MWSEREVTGHEKCKYAFCLLITETFLDNCVLTGGKHVQENYP